MRNIISAVELRMTLNYLEGHMLAIYV